MKKLKVNIGYKLEEDVKIPVYKNIPVEEEFIKFYRIMEHMVTILTRPELLLVLFLCRKGGNTGIVYNNRIVREEFIEYVNTKSKGKVSYKTQTIHQAFSKLKKYGIVVSYQGIEGAYWINPSFVHDGSDIIRDKIIISIDRQEFNEDMSNQKRENETINS